MLHVHRAARADILADTLAAILATPPPDPFTPDVVAVPTRGMERWLTQRMSAQLGSSPSARDGVCANVDFPFPGRLIGDALAAASGIDAATDPWRRERLVWPLLEVVEANLKQPWLAPLAHHIEQSTRRFARVRAIADLFDGYAVWRPAMLEAWARGDDDGWQSELWRRLAAAIAAPSPAERLTPACQRLQAEPNLAGLPDRIALFGVTRLPAAHVQALAALAAGRDVHVFALHPSAALWAEIAALTAERPPIVRRAIDPTSRVPKNRLLASWGRDARELQLILVGTAAGPLSDHHHPLPDEPPSTLLATLHAAVRSDHAPPGPPLPGRRDERLALAPDDTSVRVHACHGPARQVEVLREAILHRLAADPTLEPRDVIVMCPDIETFAPLIEATFGTAPEADTTRIDLRVRLADRALRTTNPVLGAVARLLELADGRVTASQVLDLAEREPVRRRFGFDDDDLARIHAWIVEAGVHWGLDAEHRGRFRLAGLEEGTWAAGLRRLLLGVTMSAAGDRLYERVLPVDDVDSDAIELTGRLAELVDRLAVALDALREPAPIAAWADAIGAAADALTATSERDAWQRWELQRLLDEVVLEAAGIAASIKLALPEVRSLLTARLAGRPTRANFRTGHLTICTLVPMRSVPHRVVCLLGLDDGVFPRRAPRDGDDLLLDDPHVGDRDPRSEDRQLLLDALLAAGDALIVTYTGNDERTNAVRPPAVPVGELLDMVDATARSDASRARDAVLVRHPLQPFDPRNFDAAAPWSFDPVALEGAAELAAGGRDRYPGRARLLPGPLPAVAEPVVSLSDLVAFHERPVRAFLRQRLGIATGTFDDELDDALPVELDGLAQWGVGQRMLEGMLAGTDPRALVPAELARGRLPPGKLAIPVIDGLRGRVALIARRARELAETADARSLECNVALPGGPLLTGTVTGVRGRVLLSASYSRLSARHRLAAWVRLVALTAAHPDVPFAAVTVGRAPRGSDAEVRIARLPPLGPDERGRRERSRVLLAELLALRAEGLREPLPLPCLTAAAFALATLRPAEAGAEPAVAAAAEWVSEFEFDREDREPEHVLAFGGELTIDELLARPGFEDYVMRVWREPLAVEEVEDR